MVKIDDSPMSVSDFGTLIFEECCMLALFGVCVAS